MIFALMSSWKVYACPFLNIKLLLKYLDVMVPLFVFKVYKSVSGQSCSSSSSSIFSQRMEKGKSKGKGKNKMTFLTDHKSMRTNMN
jgi:hypothetical protein